jgi:omega-6 fatty acid desaturase (delta-12 desaturase)
VINAVAAVRLYVLQHDLGHHSFFETRRQNELAGHLISPFTFAPFEVMKQNHNMHHGFLGNLEHRETTEIHTMTLREWNAAGFWDRLVYRLYRNPLVLLPVGAFYTYFIRYRWPKNTRPLRSLGGDRPQCRSWRSGSPRSGRMAGLQVLIIRGSVFDRGLHRACSSSTCSTISKTPTGTANPTSTRRSAALQGSSASISAGCSTSGRGQHHAITTSTISTRASRPTACGECHRALREKYEVQTIRWPEAIRSFTLKLWDEDQERLVPFPRARRTGMVPHNA